MVVCFCFGGSRLLFECLCRVAALVDCLVSGFEACVMPV